MKIPHYIGVTEAGQKLELHKDAVTQGFALMGKRRRGKSNLMGCMMETLAARSQSFVCIDPADAHWGIRYEVDDKGQPAGPSGLDVLVVGGDHADVPLDPSAGRELAHTIIEGDISCVICLKALNYTKLQSFCADFGEELFMLNRTPRHIFFDECQNLLPQNLKFEEQKRVLYAMSKIVAEGGGQGLGFTLASQRPSKVNKDVLEEVDNFIVLGMIGPLDLKQVRNWFEHHVGDEQKLKDIIDSVASLPVGDCWFLSPDWMHEITRFHSRLRVTYHSGRTPKPGERPVNVGKFSVPEAVEHLKKLFAAKQTERRQDVQDLAEAKKRIRELEQEVRTKSRNNMPAKVHGISTAPDPKAIARAVKQADALWEKRFHDLQRSVTRLQAALLLNRDTAVRALEIKMPTMPQIIEETRRMQLVLGSENRVSGGEIHERGERAMPASSPAATKPATIPHPRPSDSDIQLKAGARRMLQILAAWHPEPKTRDELGALAGFAASGGTFGDYLSKLRMAGFIIENGRGVSITDDGLANVGDVPPRPDTTGELVAMWKTKFKAGVGRILDVLVSSHPEMLTREDLGERSGFTWDGGTFGDYLSQLRRARLIEENGNQVKAADSLFP